MKYIEDLVSYLDQNNQIGITLWDAGVLASFCTQISNGNGFTEKQVQLAVKIIKKYKLKIVNFSTPAEIEHLINSPVCRIPVRFISQAMYKISIVEDSTYGKMIKAEFPYHQSFVDIIRKNRHELGHAVWDKDQKAWMFNLSEHNIRFLRDLFKEHKTAIDDEFLNLSSQIDSIVEKMENYVPMLVLENGMPAYKNVPPQVPTLTSNTIIPALFEARNYGITTCDDNINSLINAEELNSVTSTFLNTPTTDELVVDSKEHTIDCLKTIVKHTQPCLIIIPTGSEFEKLKLVYEFLMREGYAPETISVMFRMPSSTHKHFNDFVRDNRLNNPVSEKTKFVFICTKIPKPLVHLKLKFNCLINLGYLNVHYSIKEYMKNCQNIVYYNDTKPPSKSIYVNL